MFDAKNCPFFPQETLFTAFDMIRLKTDADNISGMFQNDHVDNMMLMMIIVIAVCIVSWARFAGRWTEECYSGARCLSWRWEWEAPSPVFLILNPLPHARI